MTAGPPPDLDALPDLRDRGDLERLVRAFYTRAFDDPLLRHVFVDVVAMDLEAHVPVLVAFWEKVLLGAGDYRGRAMDVHRRVHARVPLTAEHFTRWLELWRATLADTAAGPVADAADAHATRMARVFLRGLAQPGPSRGELPIVPGPSPLQDAGRSVEHGGDR